MGRNIRFLKSDLESFRATFKRRWEVARPSKHDGSIYPRKDGKVLWLYRDRTGKRIRESTSTEEWQEAQRKLRERLQARGDKILYAELFNEIGLTRQPSIRNCGFFVV